MATQAVLLRPGEQFVHAARVRPLPGSPSAVQFPSQMIWAVTGQRLFIWHVDGRSASQPGALIASLDLGSTVTNAVIGQFVGRELGITAIADGHPAQVLMESADAEFMVSLINSAATTQAPVPPPPPPKAEFSVTPADPTCGDPRVAEVNEALAAGEWERAENLYDKIDDPAEREVLLMHLDGTASRPGIDAWIEARPDSSTAWLFDGTCRALAWHQALASARDQPSLHAEGVAAMREADDVLLYALELSFEDPIVWTPLLLTGSALSIPIEELCIRYDESVRRQQDLFLAHRLLLEGLSDLRQSTHVQMFAFARAIAREAPAGSPLHALVPAAHLLAHLTVGDEDPRHRYFSADVRREIEFFASVSVDNDAFVDSPATVEALNIFAAAFARGGDLERAKGLVDRIGDRRSTYPWSRFPDGDRLYHSAESGT